MPGPRAPWWMYVIGASFLAFFALLSYYDFFGPDVLGVSFDFPFENSKGRLIYAPMSPALERAGAKPADYFGEGRRAGTLHSLRLARDRCQPGGGSSGAAGN